MLGTFIAALCAALLLYGGWVVLCELVLRALERTATAQRDETGDHPFIHLQS